MPTGIPDSEPSYPQKAQAPSQSAMTDGPPRSRPRPSSGEIRHGSGGTHHLGVQPTGHEDLIGERGRELRVHDTPRNRRQKERVTGQGRLQIRVEPAGDSGQCRRLAHGDVPVEEPHAVGAQVGEGVRGGLPWCCPRGRAVLGDQSAKVALHLAELEAR